ncbi:flagellar biosynthesis protein FlhB [Legionella sp. W05-934-2]|uniref:flagellar biosynthesis protein FlhB n=1 Tax=Legionella sp. W05-934-2 TaxID=1198649 RepID=UPI0034636D37
MAEEDLSQEKTEQPSPKRLKEAREKGQVARSKDFNALIILTFAGIGFWVSSDYLGSQLESMMRQAFSFVPDDIKTPYHTINLLSSVVKTGLIAVLPILIVIFILSLIAPIMMGGWVFSTESLKPQASRMNPIKGFKRMISLKGFMELAKALAKFVIIATVAILVLNYQLAEFMALAGMSIESAISKGLITVLQSFIMIASSIIIIAAIDVPFQIYEHQKQLKMTKQEMKDEFKETEGKPEVKAQIRRTQQAIAQRRMMSEVPKATVVLTNPTHYAIAIRYDQEGDRAPYIVAKGKDMMALQIGKIAKEHEVPLLRIPNLARAIYFSTDIDEEIPHGLYMAVAQVLAYILQVGKEVTEDEIPDRLKDLPIPDHLKQDAKEAD